MQDEIAELDLLRRHKSFASEIERSSVHTWMQSKISKDFESERDAYLFLSRCFHRFDLFGKCNGCKVNLHYTSNSYRCLQCKDMELCFDCYIKEEDINGHATSHRMIDTR